MSQPPDATEPSPSSWDQPGGSQEPARGHKRAPAWSGAEIVDLIEVCGEASNVHNLRTSHRNAAMYGRMADSLAARGHQRTREQVCCKIKDLRQSYSRACLPGADPEACPHFQTLDRILGAHAVHAPRVVIDPGAEGPVLDTEEEVPEDAESQEPAGSRPRTPEEPHRPHRLCRPRLGRAPHLQHLGLQGAPPLLQQPPAPGQVGTPGTRRTTSGGTSGSWSSCSATRSTGSGRTFGCASGVWRRWRSTAVPSEATSRPWSTGSCLLQLLRLPQLSLLLPPLLPLLPLLPLPLPPHPPFLLPHPPHSFPPPPEAPAPAVL
ncbi:uncharacterized protein LOC142818722 [Pelodiscus sinensis]|uniref:uncharacterized protein LOC142818722 n=1 Tax=Pelodiscus sinensis TaxID=13735 RepID=UPI003F6BA454